MQIAGVPDRHEPDQGEVNYSYLLGVLDEVGYAGWVGCEYRPVAETRAGLAWAQRWGVLTPGDYTPDAKGPPPARTAPSASPMLVWLVVKGRHG